MSILYIPNMLLEDGMAAHTIARTHSDDAAKLVLRVALAVLLLFHRISRVIGIFAFRVGQAW